MAAIMVIGGKTIIIQPPWKKARLRAASATNRISSRVDSDDFASIFTTLQIERGPR